MADDTVDLQFLARQGRQIFDELRDGRAEMEIIRTDNRQVLGELASNRAAMAGLSQPNRLTRSYVGPRGSCWCHNGTASKGRA